MSEPTQRLDKWLWYARFIKTRSQASKLVASGNVRVNREKVNKPATTVKENDVITAIIHNRVRVIKVIGLGKRRGPAPEAQLLYEEIEAEAETLVSKSNAQKQNIQKTVVVDPAKSPSREKGMGRPTKRDRRKMTSFHEAANKNL